MSVCDVCEKSFDWAYLVLMAVDADGDSTLDPVVCCTVRCLRKAPAKAGLFWREDHWVFLPREKVA